MEPQKTRAFCVRVAHFHAKDLHESRTLNYPKSKSSTKNGTGPVIVHYNNQCVVRKWYALIIALIIAINNNQCVVRKWHALITDTAISSIGRGSGLALGDFCRIWGNNQYVIITDMLRQLTCYTQQSAGLGFDAND